MKKAKAIACFFLLSMTMVSCGSKDATGTYGQSFAEEKVSSVNELLQDTNLKNGDAVQITGVVSRSCQHGQCWLSIKTDEGKEFYVNNGDVFKIPKNAAGYEVVANGTWVTIEQQRADAKTEGATDKQVASIDMPSVDATGIVLKKK